MAGQIFDTRGYVAHVLWGIALPFEWSLVSLYRPAFDIFFILPFAKTAALLLTVVILNVPYRKRSRVFLASIIFLYIATVALDMAMLKWAVSGY